MSKSRLTNMRRGAMWWKLLVALLVIIVLLIALLPTFVSWGLGKGIVEGQIEKQVNGSASVGGISASWFGTQSVRNLSIKSTDGATTADLTATLHASLLDLIFGVDSFRVDLAGALQGDVREDGSLSFQDLVKTSPQTSPTPPTPPSRSPIPGVVVNVDALRVSLRKLDTNETFVFENVIGKLELDPGKTIVASLEGDSNARDMDGAFVIQASADGALDATGAFTPAGASAKLLVMLQRIPVPVGTTPTTIFGLNMEVASDDLTKRIDVTMSSKTAVDGAEPSSLSGAFTLDQPFNSAGDVTIAMENITGSLNGSRVPTSVVQPFLAGNVPIILERDLGPIVDVNVGFSEGEQKDVNVLVMADHARLEVTGKVNTTDRSFVADRVFLSANVQPALAMDMADIQLSDVTPVRAEFSNVTLPPIGSDGSLNLAGIALAGFVAIEKPVAITLSGESPRTMQVAQARVNIESAALGQRVRAHGSAGVDELTIEFDESVTNLFDANGKLALGSLVPEGVITVAGITDATLLAFTPGIADLVSSNKVLPATAKITTQATDAGWNAALALSGNKLEADVTATRAGDTLTVQLTNVDMRVSPALVAFLQQGSVSPIELLGPAQLKLVGEPIDFPANDLGNVDFATYPLRLQGTLGDATLANVPAFDEAVIVKGFDAMLTLRTKPERWYGADGTAALALAADGAPLSDVRFDVSLADVAGTMTPTGMVKLTNLSMAALERANGRDAGTFESLVGEKGDVQLTLDRDGEAIHSTINASLPNLQGRFAATMTPELLSLTADTSKFMLSKDALNRFLARGAAPTGSAEPQAQPQASLAATSDLPLNARVKSLRVPMGLISAEAIDPALVDIDIAITGGPATFTDPKLGTLQSQSISAALSSSDLRNGVKFNANIAATSANNTPTKIEVVGTLSNLLDAQSRLSKDAATLEMTAQATAVPTALIDAAGAFSGLLVAALGPQVQALATAEEFSLSTGKLRTRLDANNGWMEGILKGRDGLLQLSVNNPMRAELEITPELRDRLLYKIHPVLADIRTTEQPLRVLVPNASIPTNGDVSKLNARIEITVGKVELDGGSTSLFLLKLFSSSKGTSIPGSIEPIIANIVNGVVTYEKFAVNVDKYRMDYSGTIDLNTGQVNLRTELPLQALSASFSELRGYTDTITVPIVTRGKFGALKTQIDPSFDIAKEALKGGLKGALGDILGGKKEGEQPAENQQQPKPEDQVKNLLEELLRGGDKKKEGSQNSGGTGNAILDELLRGGRKDREGSQNNKAGG